MLFMITFSCHNPVEAKSRFSNSTESWEGLELIGRWHAVGNTGVIIVKANDVTDIGKWSAQWDDLFDLEVCPVMDDAQAHQVSSI